ncbi:MAG: hypothetical protein SGJ04_10985 [Bacteroidota bacterium]|nr:hypothetical protein [Bacteroidota bacterium]
MKYLILVVLLCSTQYVQAQTESKQDTMPVLELFTRANIEADVAKYKWYQGTYNWYTPKAELVNKLKPYANELTVTIYAGSWCEDTQAELPRFYKLADQIGIPKSKIALIGLDKARKDFSGTRIRADVQKLPTFVIDRRRNNETVEIGKIIEHPIKNFELDLLELILNSDK